MITYFIITVKIKSVPIQTVRRGMKLLDCSTRKKGASKATKPIFGISLFPTSIFFNVQSG